MLISGIICNDSVCKTANLINSFLSSEGKKVSVVDLKSIKALDYRRLKDYLNELEKNNTDVLVLKINLLDFKASIMDYLHFDFIICAYKPEELNDFDAAEYKEIMRSIFLALDEKGIAIVNMDDNEIIKFLEGMRYHVVTYGFNSKASMTTSSIGDALLENNFMCCLQRNIFTKNGLVVEPQEFCLKLGDDDTDAYQVLAAAAFAVVNGVDLNTVHGLS